MYKRQGITRDGLIARMKEEDFDAVVGVNLKGTFNCCKAVAQRMMKQRFGRIVNMSSVVGVAGNAGQANYAASKAGVIGLTKSLARELASRNVTANAVAPGFITTDMTAALSDKQREAMTERIAARRLGAPEDVAALVRFLASDEAGYITGPVSYTQLDVYKRQLKIIEYLQRDGGKAFSAVVSGVAAYGLYVRLENTAEGFVPVRSLGREYFAFDPARHSLCGQETGTVYRLGQRVPVVLVAAEPRSRTLDFKPATDKGGRPAGW